MKNSISALIVGFLFALGLGISGMTQPMKVVGFLDLFGQWDPSLIFVMISAITLHFITYRLIRRRSHPMFDREWHVPTKTEITPALLAGSLLFGAGWALAGYCPGPAIVSLVRLDSRIIIFVVSMLLGMFVFKAIDRKVKFNK